MDALAALSGSRFLFFFLFITISRLYRFRASRNGTFIRLLNVRVFRGRLPSFTLLYGCPFFVLSTVILFPNFQTPFLALGTVRGRSRGMRHRKGESPLPPRGLPFRKPKRAMFEDLRLGSFYCEKNV